MEVPLLRRSPLTGYSSYTHSVNLRIVHAAILTIATLYAAAEGGELTANQEAAVELARAELASVLHIDEADIEIKRVDPMQWANSSLGCPQKGMAYSDVISPGYRVTLSVDGKDYNVHTSALQAIVCTAGRTRIRF